MCALGGAAPALHLERLWPRSNAGASGGVALVTMVQSADFRECDYVTFRENSTRYRRCVFG